MIVSEVKAAVEVAVAEHPRLREVLSDCGLWEDPGFSFTGSSLFKSSGLGFWVLSFRAAFQGFSFKGFRQGFLEWFRGSRSFQVP